LTTKIKTLSFVALMAALANILSFPPFAVPVPLGGGFPSSIHFSQLPILVAGIFVGPTAGLLTGAIGGVSMSFFVGARIPFIIGGLAILGYAAGFFAKRLRPLFAGILAWFVQAPYVVVTDYVWFTLSLQKTPEAAWVLVTPIMIKLTVEAVVSSALAEVIIASLKRAKVAL